MVSTGMALMFSDKLGCKKVNSFDSPAWMCQEGTVYPFLWCFSLG